VVASAKSIFTLHGVPENLRVAHPDCDHDFPDTERHAAYDWITETLR
jgi:hypothetical protein